MTEKGREWTTFGRYVLLDKIGVGGMAEIFRAKTFGAAGFEKEFAIKLILPSLVDDKEFVDMFINEAKIAVSLYHANVVQVFDLGQLDEQYYIAMEFVHGKDLLDVLARCAELDIKIPLNLVLYISMEMLKGLDFAHRAKNPYGEDLNIIHRDVSPSNILISYLGDVKVGDFGVAKAAIQRNLTESGTLKGKVGYMSPEQVMGEKIDSRSDIFSAGIVFFEALSMSRLFVGGSDLDVMLRVRDADISESLEKAGPLPSDLRDIVNRALERHREERYQNAGQFYQALVDFCFRHNIKTTESDLSNFMRRLFAEEIEREKARRRNDPQASVMLDSRAQFPSVADSFTMSEPSSDTLETGEEVFDTLDQATPGVSTEQGLEGAASAAGILNKRPVKRPAEPARAEYRYQDANGLVYGPMTMMTLEGLLLSRPPTSSDRVSVDGAQWMGLEEVEELRRVLDEMEAERESGVSRSRPLSLGRGIAVQRSEAMAETVDHVPRGKSLGMGGLESLSSDGVSGPSLSDPPRVEMSGAHPKVVDELRGNYTSYEGSFRDISFARAMARLHRSKSTGRLTVKRDAIEKSIYMNNGEIIFVDSNKEDELLGEFLLSRGIITPKQLQEGLARLSEWGGRLGDALVATGAIPAHDIFQHLSDQMREKLLEVFAWKRGVYGYFENQEPESRGYPMDVDCYETIVSGCRERMPFEHLLSFYRDRMHVALYLRQPAPFPIDRLRLRANELRVAKQIESGMSLQGLLRKFPPSLRDLVYRTVYLFHQCELVTFEMTIEHVNFPGES